MFMYWECVVLSPFSAWNDECQAPKNIPYKNCVLQIEIFACEFN